MFPFLVQQYLDLSRIRYPDKLAVRDATTAETFQSLYSTSNRLANCFRQRGIKRLDRVIILQKRSCKSLIAIMGTLKADAIYVPLDPRSPAKRLEKIVRECRPAALICDPECVARAYQAIQGLDTLKVILVAGERSVEDDSRRGEGPDRLCIYWGELEGEPDKETGYDNIDTDIAYILFTSGSTGNPKGVMITHLNVMNYIEWAVDCFAVNSTDNILNTAPFHSDMSTFDIYCAMRTGALLSIAPDNHILFPSKLIELMERDTITVWKGLSSLLRYLAATGSLKKGRIPSLRSIMFGGEVLPTKYLMRWMQTYPEKRFYNVYGPTEATGVSMYYPIERIPEDARETIPIGKPCANTEILVLKDDGDAAGIGEVGELCIRGAGVGLGYWNDVQRTEEAFVVNPITGIPGDRVYRSGDLVRVRTDGICEFVGRKDFQVKYMGYRIEPAEIENALVSLPSVKHAVVMLCDSNAPEIQELVAFVEVDGEWNPEEALSQAAEHLPPYMLPKRFVRLEQIPLTTRGKTDRESIRASYFGERGSTSSRRLS